MGWLKRLTKFDLHAANCTLRQKQTQTKDSNHFYKLERSTKTDSGFFFTIIHYLFIYTAIIALVVLEQLEKHAEITSTLPWGCRFLIHWRRTSKRDTSSLQRKEVLGTAGMDKNGFIISKAAQRDTKPDTLVRWEVRPVIKGIVI